MMTDAERVSDVDLLLELAPKDPDPDRHQVLTERRIHEAREEGRRFTHLVEDLAWPQHEALAFLKARKRSLSLQVGRTEEIQRLGAHRILY